MVVLPASPLVTKEGRNTQKKTNETHTHTEKTKSLSFSFGSFFILAPPLLSLKGLPPLLPSFVCVLLCGHTNKKEKKKEKF